MEPRAEGMAASCSACWHDVSAALANPAVLGAGTGNSFAFFIAAKGDNNAMTFSQSMSLFTQRPGSAPLSIPDRGVWGRWAVSAAAGLSYGPAAISASFQGLREDQGLSEDAVRYVMSRRPLVPARAHFLSGVSRTHATLHYGLSYGREIPIEREGFRWLAGSAVRVVRGQSLSEIGFDVAGFRQDDAGNATWEPGGNRVAHTRAADAAGWGLDLGTIVQFPRGLSYSFAAENVWAETRWYGAHVWTGCFEGAPGGARLCEEPVASLPGPGTTATPRPQPECLCMRSLGEMPCGNPDPPEAGAAGFGCPSSRTIRHLQRPVLRNEFSWQHPGWRRFFGIAVLGVDADTGERGIEGLPGHKQYRLRAGIQVGRGRGRLRAGYLRRYGYTRLAPELHEGGSLHLGLAYEGPGSSLEVATSTGERVRLDAFAPMISMGYVGRF